MESLTHLLKVNHFHEDFLSLSLKEQKKLIIEWLNNNEMIEKLKLTNDEILNKSSKTASRIFIWSIKIN